MKKIGLIGISIAVLLLLSACTVNNTKAPDNQKQENSIIVITAIDGSEIYKETDSEDFGCNDKTITIQINKTKDIKEILQKMFDYKKYDSKKGYYNTFQNSPNIKIDTIYINKQGTAIVNLSGYLYPAGTCDDPRFAKQIIETIKLNNYAKDAKIYINGEDINYYLSEQDEYDLFDKMQRDENKQEQLIQNIQQIKSHIDNNLQYFQKKNQKILGESSEGGEMIYYLDQSTNKNIYRKITATYYGEIGKSIFNLYYDINGSLIYISQYEYDYNMPIYSPEYNESLTFLQKSEYYFYKNKLIKRTIEDEYDTQNIDKESDEFKEKEGYLINYHKEIFKKLKD